MQTLALGEKTANNIDWTAEQRHPSRLNPSRVALTHSGHCSGHGSHSPPTSPSRFAKKPAASVKEQPAPKQTLTGGFALVYLIIWSTNEGLLDSWLHIDACSSSMWTSCTPCNSYLTSNAGQLQLCADYAAHMTRQSTNCDRSMHAHEDPLKS